MTVVRSYQEATIFNISLLVSNKKKFLNVGFKFMFISIQSII